MYFRMKTIVRILSMVVMGCGIGMLIPGCSAIYLAEMQLAKAFFAPAIASIVIGFITFKALKNSKRDLMTRDGFLAVVLSWVVCSLVGSLPYLLSGVTDNFIDAFFESTSAFSTLGGTVLNYHLPTPIIFWKALCHWLGGMGILIFLLSILPSLGTSGGRIAGTETPGPLFEKSMARTKDYTKLLYLSYIILTAVETLLLWAGSSMGPFEALVNSMGTVSTSGLFLHPQGIAFYNSVFVEMVIAIFSLLAGINFVMYLHMLRLEFKPIKQNVEVRIYLLIIAIATVIVTVALFVQDTYSSIAECLRHAFFQVVAFVTTSGFCIQDYSVWPGITQVIFFVLMFIGGCAASTSGGIKVSRIVILFKIIGRGFFMKLHPRAVKSITVSGKPLNASVVSTTTSFIFIFFAVFIIGSLVLSLQGLDISTTLSTTISLLSTTGLGLGDLAASNNFGMYCAPLKLFMSFLMIVGRLELFAVIVMFFPGFWNPNKSRK